MKRLPKRFLIFSSVVFLIILIIENLNHRFWLNDFKVYYEAAKAFSKHENVYNQLFALGSGFYKYSPFTLLFFIPFTWLSYPAAAVVQYILLSFSILAIFLVCKKILERYYFFEEIRKADLWLTLGFAICLNHFVRELHLGNINVVLLLALCASLWCILNKKSIAGGFLLGLAVITKPFLILLILPLLLRKEFKTILSFTGSMIGFLALPAILVGVSANLNLHADWFQTMLLHNAGFPSNNTLESILRTYIYSGFSSRSGVYILIAISILIFGFIAMNLLNEKRNNQISESRNFVAEWLIIIALMPNLFKTDTQHFLLSLPIILIIVAELMKTKNVFLKVITISFLILYGINSTDLLGHRLSEKFNTCGILGISNLVLLTGYVCHEFVLRKTNKTAKAF